MRREAGFTLIETIVALMILTGLLASMYRVYAAGWQGARMAGDYAVALAVARAELAAAGIATPLEEGQRSGTGPRGTSWSTMISPYERPQAAFERDDVVRLYWVRTEVEWRSSGVRVPRRLSLTTIKPDNRQ